MRTAEVGAALRKMGTLRKLPVLREVPGVALERDAMIARVRAHVAQEVPAEVIVREGRALQLLGLVPPSFDYAEATFDMLQDQLAGFYEPADGTMYIANDLQRDIADMTLDHELVHALQDQSFNLKAQEHYEPGQGDLSFSRSALAEGDATSAMLEPLLAKNGLNLLQLDGEKLDTLMVEAAGANVKGGIPKIMQASLLAPYVVGLHFVNALRRSGGWDAVNAAWKAPPTTSEQILHVDKWRAHEPALPVAAPTAHALGPGFALKDEDSQGEMGLRLMLEQVVADNATARTLARDWGGDRSSFFEHGGELALAMTVVLDATPQGPSAGSRVTTIVAALTSALGAPAERSAGYACFNRGGLGPLTVRAHGNGYAVTAGPATPGTPGTPGWSSTYTCATPAIARWSSEVAPH